MTTKLIERPETAPPVTAVSLAAKEGVLPSLWPRSHYSEPESRDEYPSADHADAAGAAYQAAVNHTVAAAAQIAEICADQETPATIAYYHRLLTKGRGLPAFYFHQSAQFLKVPPRVYNQWKLERYPLEKLPEGPNLYHLLSTVTHTFAYAAQHSEPWTFAEATAALGRRVAELRKNKISHNRVAQHLHISHRSLSEMLTLDGRKPRHCPWQALDQLHNMESWALRPSQKSPEQRDREMIEEYLQSHQDAVEAELLQNVRRNMLSIRAGDPCGKCRVHWVNLIKDGDCDWADSAIMKCRMCGQTHIIDESDPDHPEYDERHYAEPYSNCWNCDAPAHNQRHSHTDAAGDKAYGCTVCGVLTWVKAELAGRSRG